MVKKILMLSAAVMALVALFGAPAASQGYTDPDPTVLNPDDGTGPGDPGDGTDPGAGDGAEPGDDGTGPGTVGDADGGGGPLARTGSPTDSLFKIGGGLLLAGAAATLFATKRRTATA